MLLERVSFGPFVLDRGRGTLFRDGLPVAVGRRGMLLLEALVRSGAVVEKARLMDAAWPGTAVEESNLSVQIAALRKLLGTTPDGRPWIQTVPRVGYRFAGDLSPDGTAPLPSPLPKSRRPAVAVLPIGLLGSTDRQYLAAGLTEDIITALTRCRWFRVVVPRAAIELGQDPVADYLLRGSVQCADNRFRVSVQLAEAESGYHLWAERYDIDLADAFAIQDEIAERVIGAIEPELLRSESHAAVTRHSGNITAWDLVRQGMWHFHKVTRDGHATARDLFRRACATDPDSPEAHAWLGRVSAGLVAYGWSNAPEKDAREGLAAAARAVSLDPRDPYCHYAAAIVGAYSGLVGPSIQAAETAIDLNAGFALGHLVLGLARLLGGQPEEAVPALRHGLSLNPNDPQNLAWHVLLACAELLSGDPRSAQASASRAVAVRADFRPATEMLACCSVSLGLADDARLWATRARRLDGSIADLTAPLKRSAPDQAAAIDRLLAQAEQA
jgi:TolB-like protein